jgi:hypothetical protein
MREIGLFVGTGETMNARAAKCVLRFIGLGAILLLGMATPGLAQIFEYDDPSLPASLDGMNVTYDGETDLEWLDLTVTEGRTFDDITGVDGTNELAPGGDFEGFRHAAAREVTGWGFAEDGLYENLGANGSFVSVAGYPITRNMMSYLGCSPSFELRDLRIRPGDLRR